LHHLQVVDPFLRTREVEAHFDLYRVARWTSDDHLHQQIRIEADLVEVVEEERESAVRRRSCRAAGPTADCALPFLLYDLDQISLNPYLLMKVIITGPSSDSIQIEVRLYFSSSKEGVDHLEVVQ